MSLNDNTPDNMGLREKKKAATRQTLAHAAADALAQHGNEGASIAVIAETAGVSPRTFHNYFSSREDALWYFVSRQLHDIADHLRDYREKFGTESEAPEDIVTILQRYLTTPCSDESWDTTAVAVQYLLGDINSSENNPLNNSRIGEALTPVIDQVCAFTNNRLSPMTAILLIRNSLAMVYGMPMVQQAFWFQDSTPLKQLRSQGFDILRRGFLA